METLNFSFPGQHDAGAFPPVLVGVVGSGNLEVMLAPERGSGRCEIEVSTSARGFGSIWQAVMDDFHTRHALAGVRVAINDMGATPAVVSLRLDQAAAALGGGALGGGALGGGALGASAPSGGGRP